MRMPVEARVLAVLLTIQVVAAAALSWSLVALVGWEQLPDEIYRNSPDAHLHYNDVRKWVLREQGFIFGLFVAGICYIGGELKTIRESPTPTTKTIAMAVLLFVPAFLIVAHTMR